MAVRKYEPARHAKDLRIVEHIETHGINVDAPYRDVEEKMTFLMDVCGYNNLRVNSGASRKPFIPIPDCSHARISQVVTKEYDDARRRLEELASGQRVIVESQPKNRTEPEEPASQLELGLNVEPDRDYYQVEAEADTIRRKMRKGKRKGPGPHSGMGRR